MATKDITFVKQMAGAITPTNHSLALLKSYYRNRYRRLDRIGDNNKMRQHMCMKCSTLWQDGLSNVNIYSEKKELPTVSKKLKSKVKRKEKRKFNHLIIECTVCKNTIKMKLKKFKKNKNDNKTTKPKQIPVKTPLKVSQRLADKKILQKNSNVKPQQIHKTIAGKITNKTKNSILHLAALLKTNVKQDTKSENKLQKLLK